jgi:hypothetical protein
MDIVVGTYSAYLTLSIALTIWVAHTLSHNGQLFLDDVFHGNKALAKSVNHLLVVGFYLINLGYISLALKLGYDISTLRQSVEALSDKVGFVLVMLGCMHFFNMLIFGIIRKSTSVENDNRPPVTPDAFTDLGLE